MANKPKNQKFIDSIEQKTITYIIQLHFVQFEHRQPYLITVHLPNFSTFVAAFTPPGAIQTL